MVVPGRFQITTDGFQPYKPAISHRCDFAQLIKVYTQDPEGHRLYCLGSDYVEPKGMVVGSIESTADHAALP